MKERDRNIHVFHWGQYYPLVVRRVLWLQWCIPRRRWAVFSSRLPSGRSRGMVRKVGESLVYKRSLGLDGQGEGKTFGPASATVHDRSYFQRTGKPRITLNVKCGRAEHPHYRTLGMGPLHVRIAVTICTGLALCPRWR
jgi:hypothetical protein